VVSIELCCSLINGVHHDQACSSSFSCDHRHA
jgi:hypothetical protein